MFMQPKNVVWITGAGGRLGSAIESELDHEKYTIIPTDLEVDITDLATVNEAVSNYRPEFIINCAAMANKADAERDPDLAFKVNALGARNLAIAAAGVGATLVHLSTDDVFSGIAPHPLNEFDTTGPTSVFGRSKAAGERLVRELCPSHIIIRSSWVYAAHENDFLYKYIQQVKDGEKAVVPANQFAAPTSASTMAKFMVAAIESGEFGTFHAVSQGICSRHEFVKTAFDLLGIPLTSLTSSNEFRDSYSIELDDLMMRLTGVYEMPTWQEDLRQNINQYANLV